MSQANLAAIIRLKTRTRNAPPLLSSLFVRAWYSSRKKSNSKNVLIKLKLRLGLAWSWQVILGGHLASKTSVEIKVMNGDLDKAHVSVCVCIYKCSTRLLACWCFTLCAPKCYLNILRPTLGLSSSMKFLSVNSTSWNFSGKIFYKPLILCGEKVLWCTSFSLQMNFVDQVVLIINF